MMIGRVSIRPKNMYLSESQRDFILSIGREVIKGDRGELPKGRRGS